MARSPEERVPTRAGSGVRAVRLHDDGLKVEEIETPSPDPGEVLVRVHAAAITRDELEWPVDRLPAIPSYELSGVAVDSGDEVYALTPFDRDGVAAEYAVVPADVLAPKPLRLSHVEAAALPMGGLTAWQALFVHGRLARGERVLVTGASGGVGHIAVQLARHAGARVVESGPVDLVFDTRGGDVPAGKRVVTIAEEMPGAIYFIVEPDHVQLLELRTLVDAGELRAEVDSVFPLTEARAAFERVAGRGKRGKVVLEVGTDQSAGAAVTSASSVRRTGCERPGSQHSASPSRSSRWTSWRRLPQARSSSTSSPPASATGTSLSGSAAGRSAARLRWRSGRRRPGRSQRPAPAWPSCAKATRW